MLRCLMVSFCCWMIAVVTYAQINEQFLDSNFSQNPCWGGDTSSWKVNASLELQSDNLVANSSFYLSASNTKLTATQWDVEVKLLFNTSSVNYVDIYLAANSANLSSTNTIGYFVRLGGTQDEISLYRKNTNGVIVKIIDGLDGVLNASASQIKLRVVCSAAHQFMLLRDLSSTGADYEIEGQVVDSTYTSSGFFGFVVKQSTSSFFQKHLFNHISIKDFVPDLTPPHIVNATTVDSNRLNILFNEPIHSANISNVQNYHIANYMGSIDSVQLDANNKSLVHLFFNQSFLNGRVYQIVVSGVADYFLNILNQDSATFYYYKPQRYDVVIHEFISDPTPSAGLPEVEWVELRNTSPFPINLSGWKISDAGNASGPMPLFLLHPDSMVIVCSSASVSSLRAFGNVICITGFPSLDNDGDLLSLFADDATVIHSLKYDMTWYRNDLKKLGGWSLEMIDAKNPCAGKENWKENESNTGGTPGNFNAVENVNLDEQAPILLRAYATDSLHVVLVMNEPLKEASVLNAASYHFDQPEISVHSVTLLAPLFYQVGLTLSHPLQKGVIYHLSVERLCDCLGNFIDASKSARVGLPESSDSLDIVINEILFNPSVDGADYVELYNRSSHIVDASKLFIANRNSSGQMDNIVPVAISPYLIYPGDFLLITENTNWVKTQFLVADDNALLTAVTMPSMNDDEGSVVLLNAQDSIMDEVDYRANWHFKLLNVQENVSLERIKYEAVSNDPNNWHSAAAPTYGTPGYTNKQLITKVSNEAMVNLSAKLISPNNDGQDDYLQIQFKFPTPGFLLSASVFDGSGRLIRLLKQNYLCGTSGNFNWDGLGEKSQRLPSGIYILYFEAFNLQGEKKQFKQVVVIDSHQ